MDGAEDEEHPRHNGDAPTAVAKACAELDPRFISQRIMFLTVCLSPDVTEPQNAYGRNKLAGERSRVGSVNYTADLLDFPAHGANFVKTMLRCRTRGALNVVADQIGGAGS